MYQNHNRVYVYYRSFSQFWSLFKTYDLENWTEMFHPFKRNTFRTLLKFIVKKQEVCKLLFQQFFEQVKAVEAHLRLSTKKSYSVFDLWLWPLMGNDPVSSFRVYKGGRGSSIKEWKKLQTRFNVWKFFIKFIQKFRSICIWTDRNSNWMIQYSIKVAKAESKAKKVLFHLTHFAS